MRQASGISRFAARSAPLNIRMTALPPRLMLHNSPLALRKALA